MKLTTTRRLFTTHKEMSVAGILGIFSFLLDASAAAPNTSTSVVDNFADTQRSPSGIDRLIVNDKDVGGQSTAKQEHADGVLKVAGSLAPGRGMPGWISLVVPLPQESGVPRDLSQYTGVRVRLKLMKGMLSVQTCSSEVKNFDYHISAPLSRQSDEFQEVKIPFSDMKRAFSEQTPLNLKTVVAVNLVAAGMAKADFAYEVDEIAFY